MLHFLPEPVPEAYWKEVAEQRRLALSDTLEENKSVSLCVTHIRGCWKIYGVFVGCSLLYALLTHFSEIDVYIEGSQPEWCISTIYHVWDTPFWSGTLDMVIYSIS